MKKAKKNLSIRLPNRRKVSTSIGAVFWVFSIIGLLAVIGIIASVISDWFDDSDKMLQYESFLLPVVMMDPVPFSNVLNADDYLILQSSLWAAILGENRENYAYDDTGLLLIPSSDVDVAAAKLFGPSVAIAHRSFDDYDASYLFDPEISAYRVPIIGKVAYSPSVVDLSKNGDIIVLKVGYVAPGNIWSTNSQTSRPAQPKPDKYMYYDLRKWDNGYYISAVRDVDENAIPMS